MDSPHDVPPDYDSPSMPTEAELREMMDRSDEDVAAGRVIPLADVLADLDMLAESIEARLRAKV